MAKIQQVSSFSEFVEISLVEWLTLYLDCNLFVSMILSV